MKLEHYSQDTLKKQIAEIVQRYVDMNTYQVFFFGSRVRGDNMDRSDIDIGIFGPQQISASAKFKIQEELEKLPIFYKIDLVDFQTVSEKFKREALKNIEHVKPTSQRL